MVFLYLSGIFMSVETADLSGRLCAQVGFSLLIFVKNLGHAEISADNSQPVRYFTLL